MDNDLPRPIDCWNLAILRVAFAGLALAAAMGSPPVCAAAGSDAGAESARRLESHLLHERIDLKHLQRWNRERRAWQPLAPARATLTVVNLWSRKCPPCLAELPLLGQMAKQWQADPRHVRFLFVADPPDETTAGEIESLWDVPTVELPATLRCAGERVPRKGRQLCQLRLPDSDPVRSDKKLLQVPASESRPITLLVDATGLIRHAFVGNIEDRQTEAGDAIERLLRVLKP